MKNVSKKLDSFIEGMDKFVEECPDEDKTWVALSICRSAILVVASNHIEELGLVELLKDDLKDFFEYCQKEEKKNEESTAK